MCEPKMLRLKELRPRLATENIDISASVDRIVKVTVEVRKKHSKYQPNIRNVSLRFAESVKSFLDADEPPGLAYFPNYEDRAESIRLAFDVTNDQPIWYSELRSAMSEIEAWSHMLRERVDISFLCRRAVAIVIHPLLGLEDEVLDELGAELHFGSPGTVRDRNAKRDHYFAFLDGPRTPTGKGVLTLNDVGNALCIDPDAMIWQVGKPGEFATATFRSKYWLCDCGDVVRHDSWMKQFSASGNSS
jgi:hypothetical protein